MSARFILRKFGKIVISTVAVASVSIGGAVIATKYFTIKTIEVQGTGISVVVDPKKLTRNLLFFPTEPLRKQLLEEHPQLSDILIQKKLPDTLIIIPKLRTAIARLSTNSRIVDIDADGIVVSDASPGLNLPILNFTVPSIRIGQKLQQEEILAALWAIAQLGKILPIDSITTLDSGSLQLTSGTIRIFITQHPPPDLASTLQTLVSGFRIKGILPTVVDLRFAKPVVTF